MKKTIKLAELPGFIQEQIDNGCTVSAVVKKGRKIVARLDFRSESNDRDEVRIPCIVVPDSPFHKNKS